MKCIPVLTDLAAGLDWTWQVVRDTLDSALCVSAGHDIQIIDNLTRHLPFRPLGLGPGEYWPDGTSGNNSRSSLQMLDRSCMFEVEGSVAWLRDSVTPVSCLPPGQVRSMQCSTMHSVHWDLSQKYLSDNNQPAGERELSNNFNINQNLRKVLYIIKRYPEVTELGI